MLSLFYVVLALAAGSNASPCTPSSGSSAPATGDSAPATNEKAAAQPAGSGQNIVLNSPSGGLGSYSGPLRFTQGASVANTTATTSGSSSPSATVSAGGSTANGAPVTPGSCPKGFLNTVFNTNAPKNGGWPSTVWSSLTGNGVNEWSTSIPPLQSHSLLTSHPKWASPSKPSTPKRPTTAPQVPRK